MKNTPNARERILKTAVKVFAGKGFEGARMDQLARAAGVPKSLIYYHFKSKEAILKALAGRLLDEYQKLINLPPHETHRMKAGMIADKNDLYGEFMDQNADLLRVIFIESLKKNNRHPALYDVCELLIDMEEKDSGIASAENYDRKERLVAEFFTSIIPSLAFQCFRDSFAAVFKIGPEELKKYFSLVFSETHGAYHKYHP